MADINYKLLATVFFINIFLASFSFVLPVNVLNEFNYFGNPKQLVNYWYDHAPSSSTTFQLNPIETNTSINSEKTGLDLFIDMIAGFINILIGIINFIIMAVQLIINVIVFIGLFISYILLTPLAMFSTAPNWIAYPISLFLIILDILALTNIMMAIIEIIPFT